MFNFFRKDQPADFFPLLKSSKFDRRRVEKLSKKVSLGFKDQQGRTYLHKLCAFDALDGIKWLVSKGLKINLEDYEGLTPLNIAAQEGKSANIRLLIELGANPNYINKNGRLAIQDAVRAGSIESFNSLKKYTKNIAHIDKNGENIVFDAVRSKNLMMIEEVLINKKFNINLANKENHLPIFDPFIYSKPKLAIDFIKYGADYNYRDNDGKNFLFYVIRAGLNSIELITYLLNDGMNLNSTDRYGNNILFDLVDEIVRCDEEGTVDSTNNIDDIMELINHLIEEGINLAHRNRDGNNILLKAMETKNYDLLKLLLEAEANPNVINANNETALDILTYTGVDNFDIVSLLLEYDASANIPDNEGKTIVEKLIDIELCINNEKKLKPSIQKKINKDSTYFIVLERILENTETNLLALNSHGDPYFFEPILYGNMKLVSKLAQYGIDINQRNKDGLTIIYKVMSMENTFINKTDKKKYYSILKTIIGMGVNVNAKDSYGGITLHKAVLENDLQTIKILIGAGADLNAIDNRGRNIIHNTIWSNRIQIFRYLYSFKPELINKPDKFGVLPIHYAAYLGYTTMVLNFLDLGANVNAPGQKSEYILEFLKRFSKHINNLFVEVVNPVDKGKIIKFVETMKKDFPGTIN